MKRVLVGILAAVLVGNAVCTPVLAQENVEIMQEEVQGTAEAAQTEEGAAEESGAVTATDSVDSNAQISQEQEGAPENTTGAEPAVDGAAGNAVTEESPSQEQSSQEQSSQEATSQEQSGVTDSTQSQRVVDSYAVGESTFTFPVGTDTATILSMLPAKLDVVIGGVTEQVAVTWSCENDISVAGTYAYVATFPDGYTCATVPQISVTIGDDPNAQDAELSLAATPTYAAPSELKVNQMANPFSVEKDDLRFTWQNNEMNVMQNRFRIVVSASYDLFQKQQYVADSGWVNSQESSGVSVDGLGAKLKENQLYYWGVQMADATGSYSNLSSPQAFTTAIGNQWTSTTGIWGSSNQHFCFLRTKLSWNQSKNLDKVIVSATATSSEKDRQYIYNLYVNGQAVGLGPVRADGDTLYYQSYDITDKLSGSGDVLGSVNYTNYQPSFLCQVTAYYSDGSSEVITNSGKNVGSWKALNADSVYRGSNNTSIGTAYYQTDQDNIDATKYPDFWSNQGYNDGAWAKPTTASYISSYNLAPYETENMYRFEVPSASVTQNAEGVYTIDLGQEIIGSIRLTISTGQSTAMTMQYGEVLENGVAKYQLSTGNAYQETWTTKAGDQTIEGIGMKTFRYITIRNCPVALSTVNVTGMAIRHEYDGAATFVSSNGVLNDAFNLSSDTVKYGTQDVGVDSQNRERLPYEGDNYVQLITSYAMQNDYSVAKFTTQYLTEHGTWPTEYRLYNVLSIYNQYLYSGDTSIIEDNYDKIKGTIYEANLDENSGLIHVADSAQSTMMIDWPSGERDDYNMTDSYYNTAFNAICYGAYDAMQQLANVMGRGDDAAYYQYLKDRIKTSLIQKAYNSESGTFYDGLTADLGIVNHSAQHATVFPLAFGVYWDTNMANAMAQSIARTGEIRTSVFAVYFLLQGLYNSNNGLIARKIMSNPESEIGAKTYAAMMYTSQATMTSEAWNLDSKMNMSWSHAWGSAPGAMLIRGMFGIQPIGSGFSTFQVKIQTGGLKSGACKTVTDKGTIAASFVVDENTGNMTTKITVPANTKAMVYIPTNQTMNLNYKLDGKDVAGTVNGGYFTMTLQPGNHTIFTPSAMTIDESELTKCRVAYDTNQEQMGWSGWTINKASSGVIGKSLKITALRMKLKNADYSGGLEYRVYLQSSGWGEWLSNEQIGGTENGDKRIEAIEVRLTGEMAEHYNIYYRTYCQTFGWLDWAKNGGSAGTSEYAKRVECVQMILREKNEAAPGRTSQPFRTGQGLLSYSTHVQTYGWQGWKSDGDMAGTQGEAKRLEAIKLELNSMLSGTIEYQTHVQTYGWQDWKSNGEEAGTSGQAKRLEAIRIKLLGHVSEQYDVYYRVHVQHFGWLDWAKNGESAGSEGYAYRLEGIQVMLVQKGDSAPGSTSNCFQRAYLNYSTHVQTYGWQSYVHDTVTAGTSGQAKRLEGIKISLNNPLYSGDIQYKTHVQTFGWMDWMRNGELSGTTGLAKRLEAIQIELTGDLSDHYDIYYRVHIQSYGWLDWAKNGAPAGSEGLAKRLEAIEIVVVEKGQSAPGSTSNSFVTQ